MFVSQGELPAFDSLAQLGFKDLQDIAAERWGILPQALAKVEPEKTSVTSRLKCRIC